MQNHKILLNFVLSAKACKDFILPWPHFFIFTHIGMSLWSLKSLSSDGGKKWRIYRGIDV